MDGVTSSINRSSVNTQNMTCNPMETSKHPFLIFVYSLLFLVGLILNSFTLWFHCCGAQRQVAKSLMIYMKHLTAADLLLCISLPMRILHYNSRLFSIHLLYCSFGGPLLFLNMCASILFMGFIAANRYMKIFYTSGTHFLMTTKASHLISIITWFILLTMATPYTVLLLTTHEHTPNRDTCDRLLNKRIRPLYRGAHAVSAIIFLIVLLSLVFFYCSSSCRVRQIQQKQQGSSNSEKLVKSRRNMLVLVSVFCFCFVPYYVVRLPYILLEGKCSVVFYYLKEVTVLISVSNICLDPLIYVFLCEGFRAQLNLKQMFKTEGNKSTSSLEERHTEDQSDMLTLP
ncbi:P2Y purinoceptor 14-like [Cyprinodon tularosa]|uniref:P2Y purinoceptor 14-like n=1 Tax=Cyprinodon tularosa TaxID=77115 RepID=UPI0018E1E17C|nr:P2Y purinoceptor 14-like [Cyprinodon tularosa]